MPALLDYSRLEEREFMEVIYFSSARNVLHWLLPVIILFMRYFTCMNVRGFTLLSPLLVDWFSFSNTGLITPSENMHSETFGPTSAPSRNAMSSYFLTGMIGLSMSSSSIGPSGTVGSVSESPTIPFTNSRSTCRNSTLKVLPKNNYKLCVKPASSQLIVSRRLIVHSARIGRSSCVARIQTYL